MLCTVTRDETNAQMHTDAETLLLMQDNRRSSVRGKDKVIADE